jgi:hypothetical protein
MNCVIHSKALSNFTPNPSHTFYFRGVRQFDSAHFAETRQSLRTSEASTSVPFTDTCLVSRWSSGGSSSMRPVASTTDLA